VLTKHIKTRGEQKNQENQKKIIEKTKQWKKPIKILKKPTGSVRFRFYKSETLKNWTEPKPSRTEKTEPNRKKPSQNQFEPVFIQKNWTEPKPVGLNRFRFFF
jgi:hypothetical protein